MFGNHSKTGGDKLIFIYLTCIFDNILIRINDYLISGFTMVG
jgi:hypothetical protein